MLYVPAGAGVNHAPSPTNDTAFTQQNTTLNIAGSQLLANDSDADGDVLSISGVGGAVGGTVSFQNNTVTFVPTAGFQGPGSFNYFAYDGQVSTTGTVNVAVVAPFTTEGLFTSSQTPAVLSDPDPAQVNLGVKFVVSESGSIAGLKYYRGTGDTGTHTGSLWSSTGQLLATATFAAETASGWQSVNFSSPVTITAGTTYVASYHSNGHYAATGNFFGATYTNGSLTTPGPAAGVYTYGAGNLFPTTTSDANYWVDVLFVSTGAPVAVNDSGFTTSQGTALAISGATLLANDRDPNNDPLSIVDVVPGVGGIPTYNSGTVTFAPNSGFIGAATFNYRITDGTNDPVSASVNLTVLPPATIGQLFAYSDTPAILSDPDTSGVNLGVKFLATEAGAITGLKYYKGCWRHRHSRRVIMDQHRNPARQRNLHQRVHQRLAVRDLRQPGLDLRWYDVCGKLPQQRALYRDRQLLHLGIHKWSIGDTRSRGRRLHLRHRQPFPNQYIERELLGRRPIRCVWRSDRGKRRWVHDSTRHGALDTDCTASAERHGSEQ